MNDDYFNLSAEDQRLLLQAASNQLNISDVAIEKDIWVCWLLKQLFSLPFNMVFKGGTSLSKAYNLINRFSEDVDITVDYRNFIDVINVSEISRSQLRRISNTLKANLADCLEKEILPFLNKKILSFPNQKDFKIEFDEKENLKFYYPSVLHSYLITADGSFRITANGYRRVVAQPSHYLRDHVLIEFGVQNSTEPHEKHIIKTLLSQLQFEIPLILPEATVKVLSFIRTFWEKATLIHVECHRKRLRENPGRLSRHWYDLAMMIDAGIGKQALAQRAILESVVEHKKAFYNASYANYDGCLNGQFRLIPDREDGAYLKRDYENMIQSGMFSQVPLKFEEILARLKCLEGELND